MGAVGLGVIIQSEQEVVEDLRQGYLLALLSARGGRMARTDRFLEYLREMLQAVPWRV